MLLFLPESILLVIILILLCLTLAKNSLSDQTLCALMTIAGIAVLGASLYTVRPWGNIFFATYRVDLLSQVFKIILSLAYLFTILLSKNMISVSENRRVLRCLRVRWLEYQWRPSGQTRSYPEQARK